MKHVLVTGATGFLGRACARLLNARGWDVVRVSATGSDASVRADLLDERAVRALLDETRPTHLLHAAWRPVHGDVMRSPDNLRWLQASLFLVQAFQESGGERAAIIGSSAEYDWTQGVCQNNVTPMRPATLYGACKHALHVAVESYAHTTGLGFVWPRVFFLYGPGEHESRLAASVIRSIVRAEPAECTHGRQVRDYLHVDDGAAGIVAALESDYNGAVDIASGTGVAVRDLVLEIARTMGREDLVRLGARPSPPHDVPRVVGDPTEARSRLGWVPSLSMAEGIVDTVAWGRTAFAGGERRPGVLQGRERGGMNNRDVTILGAGMAGFGAAFKLHEEGLRGRLYEARDTPGGHTSTHFYDDGFTFDEGPHISFTSEKRLQDLFSGNIGGKYEVFKAYVNNYWRGHWIKHPAQINLHGLPDDLVINCIKDFIAAGAVESPRIDNYEDWLMASFGRTFATTFPMEYTKKYHTTEAKNLTTDWLGPRLYRPTLDQVLLGAMKPEPLDVHYVDHFRYPTRGGFCSYLKPFESIVDLQCGHRVSAIDHSARVLTFTNGEAAPYAQLVSSIPLPRLVPMIAGTPKDVLDAARLLSCSQVVLVNIGLNRPVDTRAQWTYFYDEDVCFARLSFPPGFSPALVPEGYGSIQAEVYFSEKWRPLTNTPEEWIEPTIDGLIQCGLVRDRQEVIHKSVLYAPFANVIFDHDRSKALATVHGYLDDIGIGYCGRYGDWAYIWTDQAFMSGERAAKIALDRLTVTG